MDAVAGVSSIRTGEIDCLTMLLFVGECGPFALLPCIGVLNNSGLNGSEAVCVKRDFGCASTIAGPVRSMLFRSIAAEVDGIARCAPLDRRSKLFICFCRTIAAGVSRVSWRTKVRPTERFFVLPAAVVLVLHTIESCCGVAGTSMVDIFVLSDCPLLGRIIVNSG